MSQWTHVLGTIRYDSFAFNVYPVPDNKERIIDLELELVKSVYQDEKGAPMGSEGGLHFNFYLGSRGPVVSLSGDLRDFGESEVPNIKDWLNRCNSLIDSRKNKLISPLWLRDAAILCDVEYSSDFFLIVVSNMPNSDCSIIKCPKPTENS